MGIAIENVGIVMMEDYSIKVKAHLYF